MKFKAVYTNGENYILELEDGGAALVNVFQESVDRSDTIAKYLRMGIYQEIEEPLPEQELERLDCILHGRPAPRSHEEGNSLDELMERMKKELSGLDYVTFQEVTAEDLAELEEMGVTAESLEAMRGMGAFNSLPDPEAPEWGPSDGKEEH